MRICLLAGTAYPAPPPAYGSEVMTWELACSLGEMGHHVTLIGCGGTQAPPGGQARYLRSAEGEVSFELDDDAWWHHRQAILEADVVHDCSHSQVVLEELHLEGYQKPTLTTYNGLYFQFPRFARRNAVVLSQAAHVKAVKGESAWTGVKGFEAWDVPPGRLPETTRVVNYGIDTAFYFPADPFPPSSDLLLYLGRPHPSKSVDLVLKLAQRLPDWRFKLAWRPGTEDHRLFARQYRRAAARLLNVEVIELPEVLHHEAKRALLQEAVALLTPCRYAEAFGLTTIEALACGTPAMVGLNGAGPEIVEEGKTGFVVDANRQDAVEQLEKAVGQLGEIDRRACRQAALDRFTRERMARDYLALYQAALAGERW